jgi:thiamine biosynthesis lipoprotein
VTLLRRAFRAMGTDVECLLERPHDAVAEQALDAAEAEFERLEASLSRFRPESELSRLNAAGEATVGADLLELAEAAIEARERTAGRFDPTIHDALVRAGYDRSFELLAGSATGGGVGVATVLEPRAARCGGAVRIDREHSRVTLAAGTRLDLGGIAKGYAADRVSEALAQAGPCLVSAGGDIAVRGEPSAGVWAVAVATGEGEITLGLSHGGLATSGVDRRRWRRDGTEYHHIIDPALGFPADTDLLRVTIVAASAREAETLATSLLLAGGIEAAAGEADAAGLPCVLVARDGRTRLAGGLQ